MASYVSMANLTYYDTKLKAFMADKDAEVLARAGVTIDKAATATAGSAVTYVVYQNYTEAGNPATKTKIEIGKIEIPLDEVVESGSLVTTPASGTNPAKAEIVLVLANTVDATTTSGKKEIRVDISSVASDIDGLESRINDLEALHVKDNGAFKTVADEITAKVDTLDTNADVVIASEANDVVTLKAGIKEVDGIIDQGAGADITLAKVAKTGAAADVSIADANNKITATTVEDALEEIATNVETLNANVSTTGSVLKMIKDNSGAADSNVEKTEKYEEIANPGTYITVTAYDALSAANQANYQAIKKTLSINEAIADAKTVSTSGSVVTVEKLATAEAGYIATYVVKQNDVAVGSKINIPKDFLVKSATVETVTTVDTPVVGYIVGQKYIDFVINTVDASETAQHVYLLVEDLVDVYTSGSAATDEVVISIDGTNKITATITNNTVTKAQLVQALSDEITAATTAIGTASIAATDPDGIPGSGDETAAVAATGLYARIEALESLQPADNTTDIDSLF